MHTWPVENEVLTKKVKTSLKTSYVLGMEEDKTVDLKVVVKMTADRNHLEQKAVKAFVEILEAENVSNILR